MPRPKAKRKAKRKPARRERGYTIRETARHLDVSHTAVEKGIASGRLHKCVAYTPNGTPYMTDLALAAREWSAGATKPANAGGSRAPRAAKAGTLTQAQLRVAGERELSLRIGNQQKLGNLIDAEKAKRDAFECARALRDSVLNVVARVSAVLAAETDEHRVATILDGELRLALEAASEVMRNAG